MAYQFTKDLETGNALIDKQHRELIDAVNALLDACGKGRGRNELAKTARFLQDYTVKHFADEERLQAQNRYPDYTRHRNLHEAFKKTVAELLDRLSANGPTVAMVSEINTALAGWLINHIKGEDRKLAAFLQGKN